MRLIGYRLMAGIVLVCGVLSACGGDEGDRPAAPTLRAEVLQGTWDRSQDALRIGIINEGAAPVDVGQVALDAPPYTVEPLRVDATIDAGRRTNFQLKYGDPDCTKASPPSPPTVHVDVDGERVTVGLGESADLIDRLATLQCGQARIAEVVSVGFAPDWELNDAETELTGKLVLTRLSAGPTVDLVAIRGSVILKVEPIDPVEPGQPLATLSADDDRVELPILVSTARCDGHALAESKNTYRFMTWISLDGEPEIYSDFTVDKPDRPVFAPLCDGLGVGS